MQSFILSKRVRVYMYLPFCFICSLRTRICLYRTANGGGDMEPYHLLLHMPCRRNTFRRALLYVYRSAFLERHFLRVSIKLRYGLWNIG